MSVVNKPTHPVPSRSRYAHAKSESGLRRSSRIPVSPRLNAKSYFEEFELKNVAENLSDDDESRQYGGVNPKFMTKVDKVVSENRNEPTLIGSLGAFVLHRKPNENSLKQDDVEVLRANNVDTNKVKNWLNNAFISEKINNSTSPSRILQRPKSRNYMNNKRHDHRTCMKMKPCFFFKLKSVQGSSLELFKRQLEANLMLKKSTSNPDLLWKNTKNLFSPRKQSRSEQRRKLSRNLHDNVFDVCYDCELDECDLRRVCPKLSGDIKTTIHIQNICTCDTSSQGDKSDISDISVREPYNIRRGRYKSNSTGDYEELYQRQFADQNLSKEFDDFKKWQQTMVKVQPFRRRLPIALLKCLSFLLLCCAICFFVFPVFYDVNPLDYLTVDQLHNTYETVQIYWTGKSPPPRVEESMFNLFNRLLTTVWNNITSFMLESFWD